MTITVNDAMLDALRELAHAHMAALKAEAARSAALKEPGAFCSCHSARREEEAAFSRFMTAQSRVVDLATALFAENPKRDGAK